MFACCNLHFVLDITSRVSKVGVLWWVFVLRYQISRQIFCLRWRQGQNDGSGIWLPLRMIQRWNRHFVIYAIHSLLCLCNALAVVGVTGVADRFAFCCESVQPQCVSIREYVYFWGSLCFGCRSSSDTCRLMSTPGPRVSLGLNSCQGLSWMRLKTMSLTGKCSIHHFSVPLLLKA